MPTPKGFVRLSVNISEAESEALEASADEQKRNKTELVREWIRSLSTYPPSGEKKR
jgi:hypothetical protein